MPYDISFISKNFKLLRVLNQESINIGHAFPGGLELLVRLRYLSVRGEIKSILSSISKLRNLETLVVKGLRGQVVLPGTVWTMKRLRHLHLNDYTVFCLQDENFDNVSSLNNMVALSSIVLFGKDA